MKCASPVLKTDMIQHRSTRSTDPRCQREGRYELRGKWFCYGHLPIWRTHYEIVDRILAIPARGRYTERDGSS